MSSPFGAQSTWRQLVDLIGRGRVSANAAAIDRLRMIRGDVPPPVRAASARALAFATPPADLVAVFAEDEIAVAAPVLRSVQLKDAEWRALLPRLTPAARSILRHRRDLSSEVGRALETFGSVDFVLGAPTADAVPAAIPLVAKDPEPLVEQAVEIAPVTDSEPVVIDWADVVGDAVVPDVVVATVPTIEADPAPAVGIPETIAPVSPFVSIAAVAAGLPVVAEALRQAERPVPVAPVPSIVPIAPANPQTGDGTFQISELVARIDAYQRQRETSPAAKP